MSNRDQTSAMSQERLRWIETWAQGWHRSLAAKHSGDENYYTQLPLDVATSMIEELIAALRDALTRIEARLSRV